VPVLAMVSAKGAPGVTVCAAALVAAARNPPAPRAGAVLVEFDPAGGDLEVLFGARTGEPSLLHAAADVRRDAGPDALAVHVVEAVLGVPALLAPSTAHASTAVIESLRGGSLVAGLAAVTGWVVVDAGRWDPSQSTAARLGGADVIAVVCRSTAVSIAHARDLILPLRTLAPTASVVVVQVGGEPYPPAETAQVVDAPVFGPVAWEPKGVTALWSTGATPRWRSRSALAGSARRLLDGLAPLADARPAWARHVVGGPDLREEPV
jgi:hypothetical protein